MLWFYFSGVFLLGYLGSDSIHPEAQFNRGRSFYGTPYDSTQGVSNYVFYSFLDCHHSFLHAPSAEYRDQIFKKK
jgi:hypothetical protein